MRAVGRHRTALGVLSHYDAVIWYTGDDIVTREPGWAGGNASRLAMDNTLEVRDFLNEGGQVLYTGKYAGSQYTATRLVGNQLYDPTAANAQCRADPAVEERCRALGGSGRLHQRHDAVLARCVPHRRRCRD